MPTRHRLAGLMAVALMASLVLLAPVQSQGPTGLRVITPGGAGSAYREGGVVNVYGLPIYLASYGQSTEFHVGRRNYNRPITVRMITKAGDDETTTALPSRLLDGFNGFRRGLRVVVRETDGDIVVRRHITFCPSGYTRQRVDPTGPDNPIYPAICGGIPFTRGIVWGVEQGWASSLSDFGISFEGDADRYRVTVRITKALARALGIPPRARGGTVTVDVEDFDHPEGRELRAGSPAPDSSPLARSRPARGDVDPSPGVLPDLIPLPAWGVSVTADDDGRDRMNFLANEWNAGPSPMVVEGFRSSEDPEIMDAYQIFYRNGRPVGSARTGTMEFHDAPEHHHWHFLDFAYYSLVDLAGNEVSATGKQSWCLVPTDAVDLRVAGAVYIPGQIGLDSACGGSEALWIREVLPVGWGDTYSQFQTWAIDVTDVPNGTYRLKISVNPNGNLFETRTDNNDSFRTVILGGTPGARTVEVPPYGLVDSEGTGSPEPEGRHHG